MNTTTDPAPLETGSRTNSSPAIAKARLITLALTQAAQLGLAPLAHAALAHHVAEAWPGDDGWSSELSDAKLAARLNVHIATLRRSLRELVQAGLLERRTGVGRRPSRHVVRVCASATSEVAPAPPQSERQRTVRGSASATSEVAPALTPSLILRSSHQQQQQQEVRPAAAAAVEPKILLTEEGIQARSRYLLKRPEWLFDRPWIDQLTARELAQLPLSQHDVDDTIRDAYRSRATLTNAAGYVIARLRRVAEANANHVPEELRR